MAAAKTLYLEGDRGQFRGLVQSFSQASSLPDPAKPKAAASTSQRSRRTDDRMDRWFERGILGLVLLILVFGPIGFGAVGVPQVLVIQGMVVGVLVLWVARCWASRSYRLLWPPVCWAVALFMAYAVARYRMVLTEGGIEYVARQELILVLIYGCLFFAILNNLTRQESTQIISLTLCGLGTVLSLYAVYQFVTKSRWVLWTPQWSNYFGRASGTYVCPNHLAGFLEVILPLALAFTLTGRFKPTAKVFLGYAAVVIFAGIGVTLSRGAWVACAGALFVFFVLLMRRQGQRLAAIIFALLLVGGGYFFIRNMGALQRRINVLLAENKADGTRVELWKPTVKMWEDHVWWGVGPAHFDARFRTYRPDDVQMDPLYAHNDYLNTLADWGVVGLGLIGITVGLLYLGVFQSWKYVLRSSDLGAKQSNRSAFVLGAAVGILAMLLHSAADFNMHIPANALVIVTLMALVTGHLRFATERYWLKLGWVGKPLLTVVCLAGIVYLGQQGVRHTREYRMLGQAERAKNLTDKLAWLKAAYQVEPMNSATTYELGETLRLASWQGLANYRELATEAIEWFDRGSTLNQFDPYNFLRKGMSLHWLDRSAEAGPLFEKALALDPRSYIMFLHMGWHYFQLGQWVEAREWFKKAVYQVHWHPDYRYRAYDGCTPYLKIIEDKLQKEPSPGSGTESKIGRLSN